MHPRRAILDAARDALAGTSPAYTVYEENQTALTAPSFQISEVQDQLGDNSTRGRRERVLTFMVTARGTSPAERDDLSQLLEDALLGPGPGPALESELVETDLSLAEEIGGKRTYPATYGFRAVYFTTRVR